MRITFEKVFKKIAAKYLCKKYGFKEVRATFFANFIYDDWIRQDPKTDLTLKQKMWLYKNGFVFSRYYQYGLTEDNIHEYLSDFDFWRIMPLTNSFNRWIDDKLTMRYTLAPFKEHLPEYYMSIDKKGVKSVLMDSPENIAFDDDYLINLGKEKKIIAMKPNAGTEGKGFIKYTYENEKFYFNDVELTPDEIRDFYKNVKDYIVTEYIVQCREHAELCDQSPCTLRVISMKDGEKDPVIIYAYARFGTSSSGAVSNMCAGGVGIGYDSYTGDYYDKFLYRVGNDVRFYDEHPETKISLKGKKLPNYELVRDKVIQMHKYMSSLEYLGFDIIVTDNGFKICEINSAPNLADNQTLSYPVYTNKEVAEFFDKRLKGKRRNEKKN